ncbi:MAG: endonuclease/exonuclease/phosphatase family protein [Cytophagales bacterium]|nr:endonuclease/exonuclease/phosphatase family protein [Cytophagales bacterium]
MGKITIATFNCENLFQRFKFTAKASPQKVDSAVKNGFIIDSTLFQRLLDDEKKLTAKAIAATGADIVCLQEVENLDTLKNFASQHLTGKNSYPFKVLIDGNDPRLIDVAILSKIPIDSVVTHQYTKGSNNKNIFSRDCLEVRFTIGTKPFSVFINHFKSMLDKSAKSAAQSRANTAAKRKAQCDAVVTILKNRFGNNPGSAAWAVVGDFNDYLDAQTSLSALTNQAWLENVVDRLPVAERWTHWWDTTKVPVAERYKQIDYILLSKSLAQANKNVKPVIVRSGLPRKAALYTGARFPGVGQSKPSASDHCPVAITISI